MFLGVATNEVLFNDTTRLAARAEAAGVDVTLKTVDDSVHVFPVFSFLPEAREFVDEFAAWARLRQGGTIRQSVAA
jgi:salicylate hydroxylase